MTPYQLLRSAAQLRPTAAKLRELDAPAKLRLAAPAAPQFGPQFQGLTYTPEVRPSFIIWTAGIDA